jgi:hypothetical protein
LFVSRILIVRNFNKPDGLQLYEYNAALVSRICSIRAVRVVITPRPASFDA